MMLNTDHDICTAALIASTVQHAFLVVNAIPSRQQDCLARILPAVVVNVELGGKWIAELIFMVPLDCQLSAQDGNDAPRR